MERYLGVVVGLPNDQIELLIEEKTVVLGRDIQVEGFDFSEIKVDSVVIIGRNLRMIVVAIDETEVTCRVESGDLLVELAYDISVEVPVAVYAPVPDPDKESSFFPEAVRA